MCDNIACFCLLTCELKCGRQCKKKVMDQFCDRQNVSAYESIVRPAKCKRLRINSSTGARKSASPSIFFKRIVKFFGAVNTDGNDVFYL